MDMKTDDTHHIVRGYDCGYGGSFKPLSLANYFQEAAGDHAVKLGIGMDNMFSRGITWMLSRIDIKIDRLPMTGDRVTVKTWPSGTSKVFALRYMAMLDGSENLIAGALYDYLIVDLNTRHIVRPEKFITEEMRGGPPAPYPDLDPGLSAIVGFPARNAHTTRGEAEDAGKGPSLRKAFTVETGPRHIDYNGHVNNAYFVEWLCDAVPVGMRGNGAIKRIKVDFVSEVRLGETLTAGWFLDSATGPSGIFSYILREDELIARAFTEWSESVSKLS
jgi:acyl-ACP thioesterase